MSTAYVSVTSQERVQSAARANVSEAKGRIRYIDTTRGLLFFLMTSAHALTVADVSPTSFFGSGWWLPQAGSFQTFIILSGFTVATLFSWGDDRASTKRRLRRRAGQVLIVMFVSNVIMLLLNYATTHELARVKTASWWLGLLTLDTPYSISGVLLPIGIFLLLAPILFELYHRYKLVLFSAGVALFALFSWGISYGFGNSLSDHHWLDVLFRTGAGGFAILPLVSYGAMGFLLGLLWKESNGVFSVWLGGVVVFIFVLLQWLHSLTLPTAIVICYIPFLGLGRFTVFLTLGITITQLPILNRALVFLPIIGKYAMFSFIMHRIIIQGLALMNTTFLPSIPADLSYVVYFVAALAIITGLCLLREHFKVYDRALRCIYL